MRGTAISAIVLVACASIAQSPAPDQTIQTMFDGIRAHPGLRLTLTGIEAVGDASTPYNAVATWFQSVEDGRPVTRFEMIGTRNSVPQFRIVGNGTTLWAWNAVRNEHVAARYGNYRGSQPTDYMSRFFSALDTMVDGHAGYLARLLSETYSGEAAHYRTWMPGTTAIDTTQAIQYMLGVPIRRRMEFWYSEVAPGVRLDKIEYFDSKPVGFVSREIEWTLTPQSFDIILPDANFEFVPPAGSRPLAGLKPVTGG